MSSRINTPLGDAYHAYDSDPRVNGPDDFEAFADAVERAVSGRQIGIAFAIMHAATDYYWAVKSAQDMWRIRGRRGASEQAVEDINRTRARAKQKHDALMDVIASLTESEDDDE